MSPQFLVTDINRSVEFYTKELGFEVSFWYEDFYCGIEKEGYCIHLKLGSHSPAMDERVYRKNNQHLDMTFSVEGVDALYEDIKNKQVEITQSLRDMPYGREFYISDPDGHIIAFLEDK